MKQTRLQSLIEVCVSIAIGFAVAFVAQRFVAWYYGFGRDAVRDLQITAFFTVLSIIRGYYVRRAFNWWHSRGR